MYLRPALTYRGRLHIAHGGVANKKINCKKSIRYNMPGPIVILDPSTSTSYDDTSKDPRQEVGGDPIVPLRSLLAMQKEEKKKPEQPQPSIDDSTYSHHRNDHHMNDISMSPRLLGYVFSCISSAVAMSELESLAI